jgi:hypothetical protein
VPKATYNTLDSLSTRQPGQVDSTSEEWTKTVEATRYQQMRSEDPQDPPEIWPAVDRNLY